MRLQNERTAGIPEGRAKAAFVHERHQCRIVLAVVGLRHRNGNLVLPILRHAEAKVVALQPAVFLVGSQRLAVFLLRFPSNTKGNLRQCQQISFIARIDHHLGNRLNHGSVLPDKRHPAHTVGLHSRGVEGPSDHRCDARLLCQHLLKHQQVDRRLTMSALPAIADLWSVLAVRLLVVRPYSLAELQKAAMQRLKRVKV